MVEAYLDPDKHFYGEPFSPPFGSAYFCIGFIVRKALLMFINLRGRASLP